MEVVSEKIVGEHLGRKIIESVFLERTQNGKKVYTTLEHIKIDNDGKD